MAATLDPQMETFDTITIRPAKTNITVRLMALAWAPHWQDAGGATTQAWR
jgi:hypothetical protein